jgi:hypothetical protein
MPASTTALAKPAQQMTNLLLDMSEMVPVNALSRVRVST